MSGHNKWSKIKHKKASSDAQKSQAFSKLAKMITVEAKKGGGNRESAGLKKAIEKAKAVNMPQNNIDRAIKRATESDSEALTEVRYEAYGPKGSALIIEGVTDNRNRTAAEVKKILSRHGLELAQPGSALWAFKYQDGEWQPQTTIPVDDSDQDFLAKITQDLEDQDDIQTVVNNAQ